MDYIIFILGTLLFFFVNGLPFIALRDQSRVYHNLSAAPVVGSCVLAVSVTLLYRFGLSPVVATLAVTALSAIIGLSRLIGRTRTLLRSNARVLADHRGWKLGLPCFALVLIVAVLPHILGGENFAIFQGNRHDAINYLSAAVGYANYPYAELLRATDPGAPPIVTLTSASAQLFARPTVAILYASFYKLWSADYLTHAYDFCVSLQINLYFSFLYLMLALFPKKLLRAHVVSIAFAIGFFGQYLFDINAWSELLAVPMIVVLAVDFTRLLAALSGAGRAAQSISWRKIVAPLAAETGPRHADELRRLLVRFVVVLGGIIYAYPEISAIAFLICAMAYVLALTTFLRFGRYASALQITAYCVVAGMLTIAIGALFWDGTFGFLLNQMAMARNLKVNWHFFFQAYLMGQDQDSRVELSELSLWSWPYLYTLLSIPSDFLSGYLGVYFIQPPAHWPLWVRAPYKLVILLVCVFAMVGIARSWMTLSFARSNGLTSPRRLQARYIFFASVSAFAVPVYFLILEQYWSAGKSISMLSPFIFLGIVIPVMMKDVRKSYSWVCWLIIAEQILFGIYRPYAVAARSDGLHYEFPYPTLGGPFKTDFDWDVARYRGALNRCNLVKVDIDDPFLERVAQNFLIDQRISWFSLRPQNTYYGDGANIGVVSAPSGQREGCLITTVLPSGPSPEVMIWLRRERRLLDFVVAKAPASIEICCQLPLPTNLSGSYGREQSSVSAWVWTNGRLSLSLPNDSRAPLKTIVFTFGEVSKVRRTLFNIHINGMMLLQGSANAGNGTTEIDIPDAFQNVDRLTFELTSDTFVAEHDTRDLGVQITSIVISK